MANIPIALALCHFLQTCSSSKSRFLAWQIYFGSNSNLFRKVMVMLYDSTMLLLKTESHYQAPGKYCITCESILGTGYNSAYQKVCWPNQNVWKSQTKLSSILPDPVLLRLEQSEGCCQNADSCSWYPLETLELVRLRQEDGQPAWVHVGILFQKCLFNKSRFW